MSAIVTPQKNLLFMKVGLHAGETFDEIMARKKREYEATGMVFWGYGGGTCHPTRAVQPFAKLKLEEGEDIYLAMEEIDSHHPATKMVAREYSEDGITWKPIPRGIEVRGSRYAVILGEIQDSDLEVNLSEYQVAVGPSMGKPAGQYMRGRVDKACITTTPQMPGNIKPVTKKIAHVAKIQAPFAVFTR